MNMLRFILLFFAFASAGLLAVAQDLRDEASPATAWIDLRPASAETAQSQVVPPWVEAFDANPVAAPNGTSSTLFTLQLGSEVQSRSGLLVRVVYRDLREARPSLVAVDRDGNELARSQPLGEGGGLLASEGFYVPTHKLASIHIEVPGDGDHLHTAFLSLVDEVQFLKAADTVLPITPLQRFERALPFPLHFDDLHLFGRVRAVLATESFPLGGGQDVGFDLELGERPLMAILRFEIRGAEVTRPAEVIVNAGVPRPVAYLFPDLADPSYVGLIRRDNLGMHFRYASWMPGQVVIPSSDLTAANLNAITLRLPNGHENASIRHVILELKYNWDKLSYDIAP
jgi:hypothetical protein